MDHEHHHIIDGQGGRLNFAFKAGIVLNSLYVVVEAALGFYYNSMGLLSDAGHNLSDVATLAIAMVAYRMARRQPNKRYTYGYHKLTIQASLANAILLLMAVGAILVESISKLVHPEVVDGDAVAWTAAVGVVVNGLTAWLFIPQKDKDLNVRGAFLHMAADTLVSIGVVVSGFVIHFTGYYFIDPIVGIGIALVVGWSTRSLLLESARMSIDAVPESIDYNRVLHAIESTPGVRSAHHLHIWPIDTTITSMTVHVIIDSPEHMDRIIDSIRSKMQTMGIHHSTIETETRISPAEANDDNC
ncbi:MAG: cation diffusion facilitator family transporter [Bacteroides sp.]|nr:cation diffusion facilitator family transporter [Bacteroides sp.]